jgi:transposase
MTTTRKPYNTYTKEFKLEALLMMAKSNRAASEISMKPGIRRNQLYQWKEQMTKKDGVPSAKKRISGVR